MFENRQVKISRTDFDTKQPFHISNTNTTYSSRLGNTIHRLNLCWEVRPLINECPKYDIKPFDGEAQALELWGMQSTPFIK